MWLRIFGISIMTVIRRDQTDPGLLRHAKKSRIDFLLCRNPVILQLQKEISFSENALIAQRCLFCARVIVVFQCSGNLTRQTRTRTDDTLMILREHFQIHTGLVVIPFRKSLGDDLHKIRIAGVILRQKDQVMVTLLSASCLTVKAGTGCHIHLTSDHRIDVHRLACLIKVDDTVHHTVVSDRRRVHTQFLHAGYIFFYLIRAIQQRILGMCV